MKINFIGIGAPRAGTTWVFECLLRHPDFCGSDIKEVNELNQSEFDLTQYLSHFTHCASKKIKGEYSPEYLYSEIAAQRIKKYFPNAKLLICLRKPIDRLVSHYYFMRSREHPEARSTLEEHLKDDPWGEIHHGRYYEYIQIWLKYFSKEQILILLDKDCLDDPTEYIKRIYRFVGLSDSFVPHDIISVRVNAALENKTRIPKLKKILFRTRKIFKSYFIGRGIIWFLKLFSVNIIVKYIIEWNFRGDLDKNIKYITKEPISKKQYEYLRHYYEEDAKKLEKILNRKLPNDWLYCPTKN